MPPRSDGRRRRHPRAVAVTAAGLVALVAAGGFGTAALRPLGAGLTVLGLGTILAVELTARGLRVDRALGAGTARSGEDVSTVVRLEGWPVSRRVISLLDWRVRAGAPAGTRAEARRPARVGSGLRQQVVLGGLPRGEHLLPPPAVVVGDPFGLARVRRSSTRSDTLLVLPRTVPVGVPFWESGAARRAGEQAGLLRGRSELGGVRDYEPGDPQSLIHWAQTARRGHLQTKELHGESGRGATLTVILDAAAVDPPADEEFETAVSAAASLAEHCAERGDPVAVEITSGRGRSLPAGVAWPTLAREFALAARDGGTPPSQILRSVAARSEGPRTLVLVTAGVDPGLAAACRQARGQGARLAVVLVGPARALGEDLRRAGVRVAETDGLAGLRAAIDAAPGAARHG